MSMLALAKKYPFVIIPEGQKGPKTKAWETLWPTLVQMRRALSQGKNFGNILGPRSGLIDLEVDSSEGEASIRKLFGGEPPEGPAWLSLKGRHRLYLYDIRFAHLGAAIKKHPDYPGLEFRIGAEAAQSVCPPSVVDGFQRTWIIDLADMEPPTLSEDVIARIAALKEPTSKAEYIAKSGWDAIDDVAAHLRVIGLERLRIWHDRAGLPFNPTKDGDKQLNKYPYCPIKGPEHRKGNAVLFINEDGGHAFHCNHGECLGKTFADLEDIYLPYEPPIIKIGPTIQTTADEVLHALHGHAGVYQRGFLAEIIHPVPKPEESQKENGAPKIKLMSRPTLDGIASVAAKWRKWVDKTWVPTRPDLRILDTVIARENPKSIPAIYGVVSSPMLRRDGSILATPGYDKATGLYLDIDGTFPPLMTVKDALELLWDVVCDFPFASLAHRSAWLAAFISLLSRQAIDGNVPLTLFDANTTRTGKGLLTDTITMMCENRKAARCEFTGDSAELSKMLTGLIVAGVPYILFDNCKGKLGGKTLEMLLTTDRWSGRLLGTNKVTDIPFFAVTFATSNNAMLTSDMIGRTVHCRMESMLEFPGQRTDFRHVHLLDYVKKNRRALMIAALSIPAAYIKAGRPDQHLSGWGGFESWSDLVRSSIVWADQEDCDTRLELAEQSDDETALLCQLMDGWAELGKPMTVADAIIAARSGKAPSLATALDAIRDARDLGNILRTYRKRICGGRFFNHNEKKIPKWQLFTTKEAQSESSQ